MACGLEDGDCSRGMIQRLPFSYEGIDGDIRRLGVLLGEVFAMAGLNFTGRLAVLNLACGRAI
jgi:hypothetical protein